MVGQFEVKRNVSVVMTFYNSANTILRSINSILCQTSDSFELILFNDGSTDESMHLISEIRDDRIRIINSKTRIGRVAALNSAVSFAAGTYIAILDSDDLSHPDRILQQVDFLEKNPEFVAVSSWFSFVDGNDILVSKHQFSTSPMDIRKRMTWNVPLTHSSMMYRKSVFVSCGKYDENYSFGEDFDLWIRMLSYGLIGAIPEYLTTIRISSDSMTRSRHNQLSVARSSLTLYRRSRHLEKLDLVDSLRSLRTRFWLSFCIIRQYLYKQNI